jgi:hypothetical protein
MARISTVRKGNLLQRYVRTILERDGYEVETARPKIVWVAPKRPISVGTDFFSRIDIIAVHPNKPVLFIQVSVPSELSRKRRTLHGWAPMGGVVEVWIWIKGRDRHFRRYGAHDNYEGYICEPLKG